MANNIYFMVLDAMDWSMTVKGMDFLTLNIWHIWALARIHPVGRIGTPTLFGYRLVKATGSMGNLLNSVLPLNIKIS